MHECDNVVMTPHYGGGRGLPNVEPARAAALLTLLKTIVHVRNRDTIDHNQFNNQLWHHGGVSYANQSFAKTGLGQTEKDICSSLSKTAFDVFLQEKRWPGGANLAMGY